MNDKWFWKYIKAEGFYRVWDEDDRTIAQFELPRNNFYDDAIETFVKRYNYLKKNERGLR